MTRWFRMYDDVINDPKVMRLDPAMRWQELVAAMEGEETPLSPFVKVDPAGGRLPPREWAALRSFIFERDNYTCSYCGDRGGRLECDHVLPLALGGSNDPENLTTACFGCNRSKRAKTLDEWGGVCGAHSNN